MNFFHKLNFLFLFFFVLQHLNKLNQNFQPTDGYRSTFRQSLPIIADDKTITNTYEYSKYKKLGNDTVLSFLVSYFWGERRIIYLLLVSILFPIIVFVLFETILGLRFPPGIITNIYYY